MGLYGILSDAYSMANLQMDANGGYIINTSPTLRGSFLWIGQRVINHQIPWDKNGLHCHNLLYPPVSSKNGDLAEKSNAQNRHFLMGGANEMVSVLLLCMITVYKYG